jgi:hypothetical protein
MSGPRSAVLGPGVEPAEDDHVLGNPGAPVTVLEYGDYECPYCAAAAPMLRRVVEEAPAGRRRRPSSAPARRPREGRGSAHSTCWPYISPSGSAISSMRAPSGSRK